MAKNWTLVAAEEIAMVLASRNYRTDFAIADIIAKHAAPLLSLLRESRRHHYHCDDSWYCCGKCVNPDHSHGEEDYPASHEGEAARTAGVCNCGADDWNAKIDAVLQAKQAGGAAVGLPFAER